MKKHIAAGRYMSNIKQETHTRENNSNNNTNNNDKRTKQAQETNLKKWTDIIIITTTTIIIIIMIIIIITLEIIIIITPWDQEILVWSPAGHSLISWGEGSSLAFVGNPSRDGVSIKILVWRKLKPNPHLLWVNYV